MKLVKYYKDRKVQPYDEFDIYFRLHSEPYISEDVTLDLSSKVNGTFFHIEYYYLIGFSKDGVHLYSAVGKDPDDADYDDQMFVPEVDVIEENGSLIVVGIDVV